RWEIPDTILTNMILVARLYLFNHLSASASNMALRILNTVNPSKLGAGNQCLDIRTVTKNLKLKPELRRKICCPVCFCLYEKEEAPLICTYRGTTRSQACSQELFYQEDRTRPCRVYHTQSF
ncbi:hypothetical protein DFH28DRAFT_831131, partial [Melampsora americana]